VTEKLAASLFVVWFCLSVLRQLPLRLGKRIARGDWFRLVPHWGLFALPTRFDFEFFVRTRTRDGAVTNWKTVQLAAARPSRAWLWHPQFIDRQLVLALINQTLKVQNRKGRGALPDSVPYGVLRRFLERQIAGDGARAFQFLIVAQRAYDPHSPRPVVFLSDFHGLS